MSDINPKHYDIEVNGHKFIVADLLEALFINDLHLGQAAKYLFRAGRKPDSTYLKDVAKCLWWCAKAIMYHKGTFELPPGAPFKPIHEVGRIGKKKPTRDRVRT